jgi:hypothetical protein
VKKRASCVWNLSSPWGQCKDHNFLRFLLIF